ncbi:MAG TPA: M48 family metallopeptidase [Thermoanaerobaculia bacterium]|nr:M48 family metallopeptidase [Thermoanaerobaculia bacterium]
MRTLATRFAPIAALLLLAGCASGGGFNLVSLEEEWQLGQQLHADIARQMPLLSDATANAYINRLGQQIVSETEMAQLPWHFHIIDSPEINAMNIPGGHVYVTTGLIGAADDVSELAGVVAHEVAHGVERHATENMTKAYGLNVLASLLLGQDPAMYQQILAQIVGGGAMASFGRDAEREADTLGTRYMYQAGYDPRGMVTMFEELLRRRQREPGAVDRFFSTHPLTESRIAQVRSEIATLPQRANLISNTRDYNSFRSRFGRG